MIVSPVPEFEEALTPEARLIYEKRFLSVVAVNCHTCNEWWASRVGVEPPCTHNDSYAQATAMTLGVTYGVTLMAAIVNTPEIAEIWTRERCARAKQLAKVFNSAVEQGLLVGVIAPPNEVLLPLTSLTEHKSMVIFPLVDWSRIDGIDKYKIERLNELTAPTGKARWCMEGQLP